MKISMSRLAPLFLLLSLLPACAELPGFPAPQPDRGDGQGRTSLSFRSRGQLSPPALPYAWRLYRSTWSAIPRGGSHGRPAPGS